MSNSLNQQFVKSLIPEVASSTKSKEPPYSIQAEINRLRNGGITAEGLEFNLYTLFSEINRSALGPAFTMNLGGDGLLRTNFSSQPLIEMYAPENLPAGINKERAPYDQKGIIMLQDAAKEYRFGKREAFSWAMISPSYGIGSGFVMIELGKLEGDRKNPQLIAHRLSLPIDQLDNLEFQVLKELAYRLSKGQFPNVNHPIEILGEIIFLEKGLDLPKLVDINLQEIVQKKIIYGDSKKSIAEQSERLDVIWNVLVQSGQVAHFLGLLKESARRPVYDLTKLTEARNSLINKFFALQDEYKRSGILSDDYIRAVLKDDQKELTRDASGFCPGDDEDDPELEAAKRKSNGAAYRCTTCREIVYYPKLVCKYGHKNVDLCA